MMYGSLNISNPAVPGRLARRSGFSLLEVLVSLAVFGLLAGGVVVALLQSIELSKAGSSQTAVVGDARLAQQKIQSIIHKGIRLGTLTYNGKPAMRIDVDHQHNGSLTHAIMWYQDDDNDPTTEFNNRIWYDPDRYDLYVKTAPEVVVDNVTPIGTNAIFTVFGSGGQAGTARFRFHLGDSDEADYSKYSESGKGYQGIEVRFSASPRDLHEWKRWNELGEEI